MQQNNNQTSSKAVTTVATVTPQSAKGKHADKNKKKKEKKAKRLREAEIELQAEQKRQRPANLPPNAVFCNECEQWYFADTVSDYFFKLRVLLTHEFMNRHPSTKHSASFITVRSTGTMLKRFYQVF